MITKWKVFNFKSIREETELELGPLTIFAGANSSGKSTFIQSILLIAQTLSYKVNSRSVVLNGPLVGLGQFDDIKSNNSQADQISIGFTCKPLSNPETPLEMRLAPTVPRSYLTSSTNNRPILEVAAEVSFDADPSKPQEELLQIKPRLFGSELRCVARDEDNIDQMAKLVVRPSDKSIRQDDGVTYVGEIDDITRTGLSFDVKLDDKSSTEVRNEYVTAVPVGCGLHHFLPARIIYAINNVKETAHALAIALQTDPRKNFSFPRWFRPSVQLSVPILAVLKDVLSKQGVDLAKILNLEKDSSYQLTREFQPIRLINWYESMQKQDSKNRIAVQKALSDADDLYNQFYDALINSPIPAANSHGFLHSRPPRQLFEAANYLESFFSNSLKYLGPLRDAPKPVYPLAPSAEPRDVGLRGEHTAAVLELHKGTKIRYLPTSAFQKNFVEPAQITRTLEAAVIDWLQYLGVAESVQSKDLGKLGHELKVSLGEGEEP